MPFEDHQRHVAVTVIVTVEEGLFLTSVGIHVRIVAVQNDVTRGIPFVGHDEQGDKHLL